MPTTEDKQQKKEELKKKIFTFSKQIGRVSPAESARQAAEIKKDTEELEAEK